MSLCPSCIITIFMKPSNVSDVQLVSIVKNLMLYQYFSKVSDANNEYLLNESVGLIFPITDRRVIVSFCAVLCSVASDSLRPMDCSLPGSSVCGILQARILEWAAIPSSRGYSRPRNQTHFPGMLLHCRQVFYPLNHLGISVTVGKLKIRATCPKSKRSK